MCSNIYVKHTKELDSIAYYKGSFSGGVGFSSVSISLEPLQSFPHTFPRGTGTQRVPVESQGKPTPGGGP